MNRSNKTVSGSHSLFSARTVISSCIAIALVAATCLMSISSCEAWWPGENISIASTYNGFYPPNNYTSATTVYRWDSNGLWYKAGVIRRYPHEKILPPIRPLFYGGARFHGGPFHHGGFGNQQYMNCYPGYSW